ncbi:ATP-binding response regulator [Desulfobacter vibrioformis]|uniref:ATP-binding response regulator n=1 Tax=Desulfobacter vibrioformis TaxID=34031 RepID=UPI00068E3EB5|nr:response regulator [Desulfobacter vibrioformis]
MTQTAQSIFIISDNRKSGLLAEILSGQGYCLFHASPKDDISTLVNHAGPDLVLIDIERSIRSGIKICRSLKREKISKAIPVIITAMLPDLQDKEDAFKAGCSDFITKPFSFAEVIVRIKNSLLIRKNMESLEQVVDIQTKQLKAEKERFSKLFLSSPDATCLIRLPDRCMIDLNPSFEIMFGYSKEKCVGRGFDELNLFADSQIKEVMFDLQGSQKPVRDFEGRAIRACGEIFDVSVSSDAATIDEESCLIAIIRDISARKASEKERKVLEDQLQQAHKLESIGTLAGGIAHDFNNILSVIIGYTQLAMLHIKNDRETCGKLEQALAASSRAKDLVSQILMFCRKETRELKPLNVQIIAKEVLKFLRSSFPSTIKIKQDIAPDCDMILADPTQIHQVIMNICTNAFHAMKQSGGTLDVSLKQVELSDPPAAGLVYLKPGQYIRIQVSDTGSGIPKDTLHRIFEPYYTTRPKGEGTGLGLAVVHGIVTGLKGGITVESDPGKKTMFQLFFPVVPPLEKKSPEEILTVLPRGNERILFVDDDPILVEVNQMQLEAFGYTVTGVSDSLTALEFFRKDPDGFDLVITDMTMPDMTGDVLAGKILEIRPEIPIILATGYSEKINPERAEAKGIRGYLNKPFLQRHLAFKIRELLDQN